MGGFLSSIIKSNEAAILKDINAYERYVMGAAFGGWGALATADIAGGSFFTPLVAGAITYVVWVQRQNPLEAYAAGGVVYAIEAKKAIDQLKTKL